MKGSRVGVEGVRGQTDARSMDSGQDVCMSLYGSPQDNSSWTNSPNDLRSISFFDTGL